MLVLEFKARVVSAQAAAIDEGIRTAQFVRNKCLRLWMDEKGKNKHDLNKYCKVLVEQFEWAAKLNYREKPLSSESDSRCRVVPVPLLARAFGSEVRNDNGCCGTGLHVTSMPELWSDFDDYTASDLS